MGLSRKDWNKLLVSPDVYDHLTELASTGVLQSTFPVFNDMVGFGGGGTGHKDLWDHTRKVVRQTVAKPILRWASLFHDVGKPSTFEKVEGKVTFRNHEARSASLFRRDARRSGLFTKGEINHINFLIYHLGYIEGYSDEWTDSAVRRMAKELSPHLDDVFAVARADCTTANPNKRRMQLKRTHDLRERVHEILRRDAQIPALPKGLGKAVSEKTGVSGKALGGLMAHLKQRVEDGELPRQAEFKVYLDAMKKV